MKTNKQKLNEMLSNIPKENNGKNIDNQLLRVGILAEIDAVNLYEQLAELATDDDVKKVLLDVAKEEKTHVGEFQKLLNVHDKENEQELEAGEKEVEEMDTDNDLKEARTKIYGRTTSEQLLEMQKTFKKMFKNIK